MSDWLLTFENVDSAGTLFMNTICVHDGASLGEASAAHIADACVDWLSAPYRAALRSSLTLTLMRLRSAPAGSSTEEVRAIGLAGSAAAGNTLPKELAVILSFKTNHATRSGRGHIAYPGQNDASAISGSLWATGTAWWTALDTLTAALAAGHDFTEDLTSNHLSHRVWSRKDQASYDVTAIVKRLPVRWVERRQTAP